jgi:hypothetical protein
MSFIQKFSHNVQMKKDPPNKKEVPADTSEEEALVIDPNSTDTTADQTNIDRGMPAN